MKNFNRSSYYKFYNNYGFNINCVEKNITKYYYSNYNYLNSSKFHTSVYLNSDVDKDLEKRLDALKEVNVSFNKDEDIILSKDSSNDMIKNLEYFKAKYLEITNEEISQEYKNVNDYLNNNTNSISSFGEAFPNYVKKNALSVEDNRGVFTVVKELSKIIKECESSGIDENCLEKIKLSGIVKESLLNTTNSDDYDIKKEVGNVFSYKIREIFNNIGETTLEEVYNKAKELKSKYDININPNHSELAFNLVSYGLLIRAYNKFIDKYPIPKGLSREELKVLQKVRSFSRFWFSGLVAPLMLFSFNQLRTKGNLFDININVAQSNSENENNSTKNSIFGFLFLLKKVNIWVIVFSIFTLIILFLMLDGFSLLYFFKELNKEIYYPYFKLFLLLTIIIPIFINVITLYLMDLIEKKKGNIYIPKLLPRILNRFITYLKKIVENKELLSYYKRRSYAEMLFYVVILLLFFYIF